MLNAWIIVASASLLATYDDPDDGKQIRLTDTGDWLRLEGTIGFRDGGVFQERILLKNYKGVILDSRGGDAQASLQIGFKVRDAGLRTHIPADAVCYSGCALIWLGGLERTIENPRRLGFHAPWNGSLSDPQAAPAFNIFVGLYLSQLGFDPRLAARIERVPPFELWRPKPGSQVDAEVRYGGQRHFRFPRNPYLNPVEEHSGWKASSPRSPEKLSECSEKLCYK